jgi:serine/threonine protein kinase
MSEGEAEFMFAPNDDRFDDLLLQFDNQHRQGISPCWEWYLSQCGEEVVQTSLLSEMIRMELEHIGWDASRIKQRFDYFPRREQKDNWIAVLLRQLYVDRIELGERPGLDEFEPFGIAFDQLQLRAKDDSLFLGYAVGNRYRLEQQVGAGSFGIVYRGTDLTTSQSVAIKTTKFTGDVLLRGAQQLLQAEADLLSRMPIAGIPRFVDFVNEANGCAVLIQEFIQGVTLHSLLRQGPHMPERAARIIAHLADTVQFIHRQGFLHRDLSSSNVLVDKMDMPFVLDFGLGVSLAELFDRDRETAGTHRYMSVESRIGATQEIDARDDIYALGVMLFELLTGACGVETNSTHNPRIETQNFQAILLRPDLKIPRQLAGICLKCVAHASDGRYDTAAIVARDLRSYLGEPLPKVDEMRVRLAQRRLLAWRAGMRLGCARRFHMYIIMRLRRMIAAMSEEKHRLDNVGLDLIIQSGKDLLTQYAACCEFAGGLDLTLANVPRTVEFWSTLRNRECLTAAQLVEWLSEFVDDAGRTVSSGVVRTNSHLNTDGPRTIAVFQLGLLCGALPVAPSACETVAYLTKASTLPSLITLPFIQAISARYSEDELAVRHMPAAISWERDRLHMSAQRELSHQIADELTGSAVFNEGEPCFPLDIKSLLMVFNSIPERELYG